MPKRMLSPVLALMGVFQLAQALIVVIDPRFFFDELADFGSFDPHGLRDNATWVAGFGIALLVAAARPAWRTAVCGIGVLAFGLHTINHIFDVDIASDHATGVFDIVSLALLTLVFVVLGREAARA